MSNNIETKNFTNRIHFVGRITVAICLITFIMVPIILSIIYEAPIDYSVTMKNGFTIFIMFIVVAVSENISYAPIIGPGALYTSCITGDLSNMKVPAAINAMELLKVKQGTEKGDVISIIAVSMCTFVTAVIALAGMLFLAPIIAPIFENEIIQPAFSNLIPAIFGALLLPSIIKSPKTTLPVFVLPIVLILIIGRSVFSSNQGYVLIGCAIVSILYSYFINKKDL
jgi:hypothetical protein